MGPLIFIAMIDAAGWPFIALMIIMMVLCWIYLRKGK